VLFRLAESPTSTSDSNRNFFGGQNRVPLPFRFRQAPPPMWIWGVSWIWIQIWIWPGSGLDLIRIWPKTGSRYRSRRGSGLDLARIWM